MSDNVDEPLRVDSAPVGPWARAERTAHGTRLVSVEAPAGVRTLPGPDAAVRSMAPRKIQQAEAIADGKLVLAFGEGAAYSLRVPEMSVVHTRRPPGHDRIDGAGLANAGLLHGDEGWRMVVLPSLGDVATDLGHGPITVRPDGRALAVAIDDGVEEFDLTTGETLARHEIETPDMSYAGDGSLFVAAGAAIARPGGEAAEGSPIVAMTCATKAWRAVARHADGRLSVWDLDGETPQLHDSYEPPVHGPMSICLSSDGALIGTGTPFAEPAVAALIDAESGSLVRHIAGARVISPLDDGQLIVGGDWGLAFLRPTEEES